MKDKKLEKLLRACDDVDHRRDDELAADGTERYIVRIIPEPVSVETLQQAFLSRLPRCYEWTIVPGPDIEQ